MFAFLIQVHAEINIRGYLMLNSLSSNISKVLLAPVRCFRGFPGYLVFYQTCIREYNYSAVYALYVRCMNHVIWLNQFLLIRLTNQRFEINQLLIELVKRSFTSIYNSRFQKHAIIKLLLEDEFVRKSYTTVELISS